MLCVGGGLPITIGVQPAVETYPPGKTPHPQNSRPANCCHPQNASARQIVPPGKIFHLAKLSPGNCSAFSKLCKSLRPTKLFIQQTCIELYEIAAIYSLLD